MSTQPKKRNRALQRRVRERMARTDESYQLALRREVEAAQQGRQPFLAESVSRDISGPVATDDRRVASIEFPATLTGVQISGYRSIYELRFSPGRLTVITGSNGVGKTSICRSLELLGAAAQGQLAAMLGREGGLKSALWAGPEQVRSPAARQRSALIQGTVRKRPIRVRLGVQLKGGVFEMRLGFATPSDLTSEVKEEWLWPAPARHARQPLLIREGSVARCQGEDGKWHKFSNLDPRESVLSQINEPFLCREFHAVRGELQDMHFYNAIRTEREGMRRVASGDVHDRGVASAHDPVAAELRLIEERGDADALHKAVWDGLRSELVIDEEAGRLQVGLRQPGKLRAIRQEEWSDGTRQYVALLAWLLAPRPTSLVCFDEPEVHLHPGRMEQLATLLVLAAQRSDIWVTTHAITLVSALKKRADVTHIELELDEDGGTAIPGQRPLDLSPWP
jgi:predicted ATPase